MNDRGYLFLKNILRSPISIFLYSLLHPDWTAPLAQGSSKKSRQYTGDKDFGETDGMLQFAEEKISEGYDFVIMGHRHKPLEQKIYNGHYLNLGDWISYNTYATFDGKKIELKVWDNPSVKTERPKPAPSKRLKSGTTKKKK